MSVPLGNEKFRPWIRMVVCGLVALAGCITGCSTRKYYCATCLALRVERAVGVIGLLPETAVWRSCETRGETYLATHVFGPEHEHRWRTVETSQRSIFTHRFGCGEPRTPTPVQLAVETDSDAQARMVEAIRSGELSADVMEAAILCERGDGVDEGSLKLVLSTIR